MQTTRFEQAIIFFTIFYIGTMLIVQYKQNYFAEENYHIQQISEKEQQLASKVEVGLFVNNFPKFSFYKNEFEMDAAVWFRFPVGSESIYTIEDFSFKNGEILYKSEPITKLVGNEVVVGYHVLVRFITPLNYKYFPASDHKLTIILQNKSASPNELYFEGSEKNFRLSPLPNTGNWVPLKKYFESGYTESKLADAKEPLKADFPSVVFTIDFYNEDLRHYIILYLPLLLLFFLIFSSLLTHVTDVNTRLAVVAGVTPILALHSFVIDTISPASSSMTKIDIVYIWLIFLALIILLFQSYVGIVVKQHSGEESEIPHKKEQQLKQLNDLVIVAVLLALTTIITYTTFT